MVLVHLTSYRKVNSGDEITVWFDGVLDSAESTAVTKYDGSGDITGMVLNTNQLTVGSDDNQSMTVAEISQYDCDSDEDIMHDGDTNMDTSGCTNSYGSDETLLILSGSTLQLGTNVLATAKILMFKER